MATSAHHVFVVSVAGSWFVLAAWALMYVEPSL
jgi:hypothetical protein